MTFNDIVALAKDFMKILAERASKDKEQAHFLYRDLILALYKNIENKD